MCCVQQPAPFCQAAKQDDFEFHETTKELESPRKEYLRSAL
jgi:hypothetical protein